MSKSYKVSIVAVMIAISVASRIFFLAPQVKPFTAIIIFSGVMLGKKVGTLVGMLSSMISGLIYGLNVIVAFQILCFGMIGYIAGMLFWKKSKKTFLVALYGFFAVFCLYAPIMNYVSACLFCCRFVSFFMFLPYVFAALIMDLMHSISTFLYLMVFFSSPVQKIIQNYRP